MENRKVGMKKKSPDGLAVVRAYRPPGSHSPKQWMNYLTNLTYTYNPSTTPGAIYLIIANNNTAIININITNFTSITWRARPICPATM